MLIQYLLPVALNDIPNRSNSSTFFTSFWYNGVRCSGSITILTWISDAVRNNVFRRRLLMTSFARKVYKVVLGIGPGQVRSYKWVAKKAGSPRALRAVGQALKKNPYPLIIPCHRVVLSSGQAGGYILGRNFKKQLLGLEKEICHTLSLP